MHAIIILNEDGVNSGRVFIYFGTVYKFYDSKNKHLKPNADLIHAIGENNETILAWFCSRKDALYRR